MTNERILICNEKIKQFIKDDNSTKVTMYGVKKYLEKLEPILLQMYSEHIYDSQRGLSDAGYMGWDYDTKEVQNMIKITDKIKEYFFKIYVLVEKGLGKSLFIEEDKT